MEYKVPTKVGMDISFRKIPSRQSRHALKIIVAMKLIALLFLFNLQVTASVYSQRISLTASNTPLREVLQAVRKQSGYSFFVESDNLRDSKPVNLQLMENSVPEALDKIFENQPFTYTIENNVIVVTRKLRTNLSAADFLTFDNGGPDSTKVVYVQGRVQDDKGQPLVGVSIRVKGGGTGTVTKPDGTYTLKTNAAATLVFSYIGYLSREVKASQGSIDVVLKQLNTALDQVQVIAYGTTTKRFSTGNIATVGAEVIERQPVSNPLLAIQGRVPGIFIQQTNGISAGNVTVNIQGINSLQRGTNPFYVIDGVPYTPQNLSPTLMAGSIIGIGGSTLGYINPNDIESISILKDADATSIYGSRAANGAILITTKRGKSGITKVNFDLQTGWSKAPKYLTLQNTSDYLKLRLEGKQNDNSPITSADYDLNGVWDSTKYTNWQKELIGNTARFSNLQGSVSGGNQQTQFFVSGGYLKETTVYPTDMSDTKVNVHVNLHHQTNNQKLRLNITSTYLQDDNSLPTIELMGQATTLSPNAPSLYKSDGTLNWGRVPNTNTYSFFNPLSFTLRKYTGSTNNIVSNAEISYLILPGLEVKANFGYNKIQTNENSIVPQSSFSPGITANLRSASNANKSITSWVTEPQINYNKEFNFGQIGILIGSTFQQVKNYVLSVDGTGFSNDAQLTNLQSAPNLSISTSLQSLYRYNALFGRITYNYQNKYFINLNGRRDGSTRFGSANRLTNFYSVSGGWVFSDETFIKNSIKFLSFGKLRASYGTTGNDQIGDYQYLTLYNNIVSNIPYQQTIGLQPSGHSNPYLQWELTNKTNIGLDLGIIQNKIVFNINYYNNRSRNQLISYPLGFLTGFATINQNINATIQNRGIELQVEASILNKRKFTWSSSFNITANKNKLLKFDNLSQTTLSSIFVIGKPTTIQKVYPFVGVNSQTGLYEYLTADGKKTSSPSFSTDRTQTVDINPKFYGGISNTFSYNGFTLDFLFQFVKQTGRSNTLTLNGRIPGTINNMPIQVADHWKKPGDQATYQKISTSPDAVTAYIALLNSDAQYTDASYIRLKNISLAYNLKPNWLKRLKMQTAKFYIQGQNLLTITNYFGADPESQLVNALPPLRTITVGTNIVF